MTYRLRTFLPLLLLLLLTPLIALAESTSPFAAAEISIDKGVRRTVLAESIKNDYSWSSSDKTIATVDSRGRVTGRKPGVVTITAIHDDGSV